MNLPPDPAARLFLSTVAADFDATRDAALGPWCFAGAESACADWEDLPFFDAFDDQETYAVEANRAGDLAMVLADDLGRRLNARHGVDYDRHHWRLVLVPWLSSLVQVSWIRFVHMRKFIRLHGNRAYRVEVDAGDSPWAFRDTEDFVDRGVPDPGFNAWMLSRMVRRLAPETWSLEPGPAPRGPEPSAPAPAPERGLRRRLLPDRLCVGNVPGLRWGKLVFSLYVNCLPRHRGGEPAYEPDPRACRAAFPEAYLEILGDLAIATEPRSFGDGFTALDAAARDHRYVPGRLLVGFVELFNERERFMAAHARSHGERLVIVQHGGGYGTKKCNPDGNNFEFRQYAFLTWGWSEVEGGHGRFVPLPAPVLNRWRNRHRRRDDGLVFVGTQMKLFPRFFYSGPQPAQTLAYRREKVRFVESLDAALRPHLRYRPYFHDRVDLEDEDYLRRRVGDLDLVTGDLRPHLLGCRLAVIDHPITTLALVLAADTPTVFYFDERAWPRARQARPLFEALARVGVWCRDGASAAAQVNAVWHNVDGWWNNPMVQKARQDWCRQFAWGSRLWWVYWTRALWHLSRQHGEPAR